MLQFISSMLGRGKLELGADRVPETVQKATIPCVSSEDGLTVWNVSDSTSQPGALSWMALVEDRVKGKSTNMLGMSHSGSIPNIVEISRKSTETEMDTHHDIAVDSGGATNITQQLFSKDNVESCPDCMNTNQTPTVAHRAQVGRASCFPLVNILKTLVHFPAGFFDLILSMWNCVVRCPHDNEAQGIEQCVQIMAFEHFWGAGDVSSHDRLTYKSIVASVFDEWPDKPDRRWMERVDGELREIVKQAYIHRLQVWLDLAVSTNKETACNYILHSTLFMLVREASDKNLIETFICTARDKLQHPLMSGSQSGIALVFNLVSNGQVELLDFIFDKSSERDVSRVLNEGAPEAVCSEGMPATKLPLSLAVLKGDGGMVKTLLKHGAEMWKQDVEGNVFHVISLLSEHQEKLACEMFQTVLDLIPLWLKHSRELAFLSKQPHKNQLMVPKVLLLKSENTQGMTPLKVAGMVGCSQLVDLFLGVSDVYKFQSRNTLLGTEPLYDFSEMDPLLSFTCNVPSLLETFVIQNNDKHLPCLEVPAIKIIAKRKQRLHLPTLAFVSLRHLAFAIFLNSCSYHYILPFVSKPSTSEFSGNVSVATPASTPLLTIYDYILMVYIFLTILYFGCICYAFWVVGHRLKKPTRKYILMCNYLQTEILAALIMASCVYLVFKVLNRPYRFEVYALSTILLLSWIQVLQCTRLLPHTGFFALMLGRVLLTDILRFVLIIFILVLAFSSAACAFFYTVDTDRRVDVTSYLNLGNVMLAFIKLAFGIADFGHLMTTQHPFTYLLYIFFLLVANVLVFNLLIAAMSSSYAAISANHEVLCDKVVLQDMIITERILPAFLLRRATNIYQERRVTVHFQQGVCLERLLHLMPASGEA